MMVACMKTLLMLYNFLLWASGILMLCIGIWVRMQIRNYDYMNEERDGTSFVVMASLGAVLAVASTLACCCTARGHPALLYLYGAFLAVVALLELGASASVYAFRTTLNDGFDRGFNESMVIYGQDHAKTVRIDTIQSNHHCCGNRWYTDWLTITPPKIPNSCCKVPVEQCDTNNMDDIYVQGCYIPVHNIVNRDVGYATAVLIGMASFPLVGVFLACCLASNINKAKYEQVA